MAGYSKTLQKINIEYWNKLTPESIINSPDFDMSVNVVEQITPNTVGKPIVISNNQVGIKMVGGRFKLF